MKKFTNLFEANAKYDKNDVEDFLKKHNEIDVITKIGQRLFVPGYMHTNGKMEGADEKGMYAMLMDGTKLYVPYSEIKNLKF